MKKRKAKKTKAVSIEKQIAKLQKDLAKLRAAIAKDQVKESEMAAKLAGLESSLSPKEPPPEPVREERAFDPSGKELIK